MTISKQEQARRNEVVQMILECREKTGAPRIGFDEMYQRLYPASRYGQ